ncbi:uncharacterized protein LOC127724896 [Mytilus californianus]|uniref:uncharacterized protein LOC127724896 n=1 Tax=Mytilus californianus TaxID=6549 RepID=UPI00224729E3|nr:uncharacterized protein LOC127724896 [Mytilus californianus]
MNANLRTDHSFRHKSDDGHHNGESPFLEARIGMVSDYDKARKKLKIAEVQSDLFTEPKNEDVSPQHAQKEQNGNVTLSKPPYNHIDRPSTSRDLISTVANVQSKTSEFEIKTLKGLEQIKTQVHYNTSLLLQKVDVQQTVDAEDNDDNELPVLPIKTMLQLEGVENALKVNTTKNRLIKHLSTSGEDTVKQSVRRIMSSILENCIAMKLNRLERGDKTAFSRLILKDVLIKSVRKNRSCKESSDKEIEDAAKYWLRFSLDREGSRKQRREIKNNINNTDTVEIQIEETILVVTTNDIKFKINKVSSSELVNFQSGSGTNTTKISSHKKIFV